MVNKGITPDRIARAALELVDAEGADRLSMRNVARLLGIDPMAIYRHVANKDALLNCVVDAVLAEADLSGLRGDRFDQLAMGARRVYDALRQHPKAAPLLSARTWTTPAGLRVIEWGLTLLRDAGVPAPRAAVTMNATGLFLTALASAAGNPGPEDLAARVAGHPTLSAMLAAGAAPRSYDEMLDVWLEIVIADLRRAAADA